MKRQREGLLSECPLLEERVVRALEAGRVETIGQLMGQTVEAVMKASGLGLEEVEEAVREAATWYGGQSTDGFQLVTGELGPQHLPTGRSDCDRFLGGGLPVGQLLELLGPSAVGKTQLSLWLAVQLVRRSQTARVLFISSDCSLDAERMRDFLAPTDPVDSILDRVHVHHCFDADQLMHLLYRVRADLSAQSLGTAAGDPLSLVAVFIDSVAPLIAPCLGKMPYGHSLIFSLRTVLLEIAHASAASIVVTNFTLSKDWSQGRSDASGMSAASNSGSDTLSWAMGPSWGTVADVRVWMSATNEGDKFLLTMPGIVQRTCYMQTAHDGLTFRTEAEDKLLG